MSSYLHLCCVCVCVCLCVCMSACVCAAWEYYWHAKQMYYLHHISLEVCSAQGQNNQIPPFLSAGLSIFVRKSNIGECACHLYMLYM